MVPLAPTKKKQKKSHKRSKELCSDRIAMERKRRKLTNDPLSSVSSPIPTVPPATTVAPPPPATTMIMLIPSARQVVEDCTGPIFTNRVQSIQKPQGVRFLDDTKIIVSLRKRFFDVIKLAKKTPLDSKGLKKIVNSNFSLAYNPSASHPVTRRSRSPVPGLVTVTQSQNSSQESASQQEADIDMPDLPHAVPLHGTIESNTFRWYLLEGIMAAPVNESWVVLVSMKHHLYASYLNLSRKADPLTLKYIRAVPFIQLKAIVTVNCQYDDLCYG
jgi:hypothetical protein